MKLKVLILIDWYLPGNKAGGPVKSIYSLVKALNEKIDFYIITKNTDIASDKKYDVVPDKWNKYENINVFYFSNENISFKSLIQQINLISPDIIYLNSFWSYHFSILPLILKKLNKIHQAVILAPRGMLEAGAMDIKSIKKKVFLFFSKLINLQKNILFHATSEDEKKSIKRYLGGVEVFQISNLSYIENNFRKITKHSNSVKLFYLSRISPIKNLDFAIDVLSSLSVPDDANIEYDIYGNNEDKDYFKYCKELIKKLSSNIKVTYKGTLDFNAISEVISNYHFLFLPTKNENFGHAIVETLSCRRPVLISNCTPWNDVNKNKCGFALELNNQLFEKKLAEILKMDDVEFQLMCENALKYIHEKLNIEKIKSDYLKLFEYAAHSTNENN